MAKYVLLVGAKHNVGDFLIADRAKKLLQTRDPQTEFLELPRWQPITDSLEQVNSTHALILCGGPAYQPHFYPGIYPLVEDLDRIKVPIIPFGLGWKGFPGDETCLQNYSFTSSSLRLLRKIHEETRWTSCRDYLTKRVLARQGFTNVIMTGDPVWYDLAYIGKSFVPSRDMNTIVFSVPARSIYHRQSIDLAKAVKELLPKAELLCAFHHGWEVSEHVPSDVVAALSQLRGAFDRCGFETISLAGDLRRMESLYGDADLHIGYRLHAHLLFLSQRKPSFLMVEDGRGRGAGEALGSRGIQAWSRSGYEPLIAKLPKVRHVCGPVRKILGVEVTARRCAVEEITCYMQEELENAFPRFRGLGETIDAYHEVMMNFIDSLP